jgi:ATP phosphoribosyltransferase
VMESETHLIANKGAYQDAWKREKIDTLALMLNAAINAQSHVGLMLNVQKADLAAAIAVLPAINSPTVSSLSDAGWHAVNTILPEDLVRTVIPKLKSAGATGIVEYPLNKVVL